MNVKEPENITPALLRLVENLKAPIVFNQQPIFIRDQEAHVLCGCGCGLSLFLIKQIVEDLITILGVSKVVFHKEHPDSVSLVPVVFPQVWGPEDAGGLYALRKLNGMCIGDQKEIKVPVIEGLPMEWVGG